MKHCTIPDHWTGQEALAFVALLDRLSLAIWRAHGADMARCLGNLNNVNSGHSPALPGPVSPNDHRCPHPGIAKQGDDPWPNWSSQTR